MANYLVYTSDFGVITKTDDSIESARNWARTAFPNDRRVTVVKERRTVEKIPTGSLLRQFKNDPWYVVQS